MVLQMPHLPFLEQLDCYLEVLLLVGTGNRTNSNNLAYNNPGSVLDHNILSNILMDHNHNHCYPLEDKRKQNSSDKLHIHLHIILFDSKSRAHKCINHI